MRISTVIILLVAMMSANAAEDLLDSLIIGPFPPLPWITYDQPFWLPVDRVVVAKDTSFMLNLDGITISPCPRKAKAQCILGNNVTTELTFIDLKKLKIYPVKFVNFTPVVNNLNKVVNIDLLELNPHLNSKFYPKWLTGLINKLSAAPVANPPAEIIQYQYYDTIVYYLSQECCDIPSSLYDVKGHVLCHPDGGFTGEGDGGCPDFLDAKTQGVVIWQDERGDSHPPEFFPQTNAAELVITPYSENSCGNDLIIASQLLEPYLLFDAIADILVVEYPEWPNDLAEVITPPTGIYTKGFILNAAELYVEVTMRSENNGVLPCLADKSIRFFYRPDLSKWACSVNIPNGVPSEYIKLFPMPCN